MIYSEDERKIIGTAEIDRIKEYQTILIKFLEGHSYLRGFRQMGRTRNVCKVIISDDLLYALRTARRM